MPKDSTCPGCFQVPAREAHAQSLEISLVEQLLGARALTAVSCLRADSYEQGPCREFAMDGTLVTDGWFEGSVLAKTWTRWDRHGAVLVVQRFSDKPSFEPCVEPNTDHQAK